MQTAPVDALATRIQQHEEKIIFHLWVKTLQGYVQVNQLMDDINTGQQNILSMVQYPSLMES